MTPSNIEKQFNEFVSSNPTGTYEEWIGSLHPEAKEKCLLEGLGGEIIIDQEYYTEDNDHRKLWNEHLDKKRTQVPAIPSGCDSSDNHDSAIFDLLGDGEAMLSPPSSPKKDMSPDQDLLSFE
mmetsp:Transcript_66062/g.184697  ORF Transcript_66062/g.184697 Transcript_66062/m.184697 type:complete len:123 (+) Transcript_66062:115-483(+)|eukprot:CAMPEP_0176191160 /NCGR_PEP_ID=MMETSP0121_2-20121125/4320_1 /TAXON_ID=160619 /ORGANISM="Kryptoperidinium foliaceum, Strain CCMP 1326" /LENGTH=122 /DNA_ID=CAMNT_0017529823 /DNA_START=82 /DNA_END=450 /DNA_ORIENTATION=+